jgi:hypothetical protein
MPKRDLVEESLHYLMINVLVDKLEKEGFTVRADHVGGLRQRPESIEGYVPDIEATRGAEVQLIEVETVSTLDSEETCEQLGRLASASRGRVYLAVPHDCLDKAKGVRKKLAAGIVILPCYPFVRYVGMPK